MADVSQVSKRERQLFIEVTHRQDMTGPFDIEGLAHGSSRYQVTGTQRHAPLGGMLV
ncbi:hypothetical protein D3C87_2108210 [compost metagenome]